MPRHKAKMIVHQAVDLSEEGSYRELVIRFRTLLNSHGSFMSMPKVRAALEEAIKGDRRTRAHERYLAKHDVLPGSGRSK